MILNLTRLRGDYKSIYKNDWKTGEKITILIEVTKVEQRFRDSSSRAAQRIETLKILQSAKISLRTLQRWKCLWRQEGVEGLSPKKRGHPKKIELSRTAMESITEMRKKYRWGSEVIQAHLLKWHSISLNRYRIDRFLRESGLRDEYPCTTRKRVKAKKRRHTKRVVVPNPGEHTQMDIKYQLYLLKHGRKAYVYNFVDHASSWSFKRAYEAISAANTADFMEKLLNICPFRIMRLQTDNGVEFTFKWASKHPDDPREHPLFKICHRESIRHVLIPPGEKELQGLVERAHRQDDQELCMRIAPEDIDDFNRLLGDYSRWRNARRGFKKLSWLSPDEWLVRYFESVREDSEELLAA